MLASDQDPPMVAAPRWPISGASCLRSRSTGPWTERRLGTRPAGRHLGIEASLVRPVLLRRVHRRRSTCAGVLRSRRLVAEGVGGLPALLERLVGGGAVRQRQEAHGPET